MNIPHGKKWDKSLIRKGCQRGFFFFFSIVIFVPESGRRRRQLYFLCRVGEGEGWRDFREGLAGSRIGAVAIGGGW